MTEGMDSGVGGDDGGGIACVGGNEGGRIACVGGDDGGGISCVGGDDREDGFLRTQE